MASSSSSSNQQQQNTAPAEHGAQAGSQAAANYQRLVTGQSLQGSGGQAYANPVTGNATPAPTPTTTTTTSRGSEGATPTTVIAPTTTTPTTTYTLQPTVSTASLEAQAPRVAATVPTPAAINPTTSITGVNNLIGTSSAGTAGFNPASSEALGFTITPSATVAGGYTQTSPSGQTYDIYGNLITANPLAVAGQQTINPVLPNYVPLATVLLGTRPSLGDLPTFAKSATATYDPTNSQYVVAYTASEGTPLTIDVPIVGRSMTTVEGTPTGQYQAINQAYDYLAGVGSLNTTPNFLPGAIPSAQHQASGGILDILYGEGAFFIPHTANVASYTSNPININLNTGIITGGGGTETLYPIAPQTGTYLVPGATSPIQTYQQGRVLTAPGTTFLGTTSNPSQAFGYYGIPGKGIVDITSLAGLASAFTQATGGSYTAYPQNPWQGSGEYIVGTGIQTITSPQQFQQVTQSSPTNVEYIGNAWNGIGAYSFNGATPVSITSQAQFISNIQQSGVTSVTSEAPTQPPLTGLFTGALTSIGSTVSGFFASTKYTVNPGVTTASLEAQAPRGTTPFNPSSIQPERISLENLYNSISAIASTGESITGIHPSFAGYSLLGTATTQQGIIPTQTITASGNTVQRTSVGFPAGYTLLGTTPVQQGIIPTTTITTPQTAVVGAPINIPFSLPQFVKSLSFQQAEQPSGNLEGISVINGKISITPPEAVSGMYTKSPYPLPATPPSQQGQALQQTAANFFLGVSTLPFLSGLDRIGYGIMNIQAPTQQPIVNIQANEESLAKPISNGMGLYVTQSNYQMPNFTLGTSQLLSPLFPAVTQTQTLRQLERGAMMTEFALATRQISPLQGFTAGTALGGEAIFSAAQPVAQGIVDIPIIGSTIGTSAGNIELGQQIIYAPKSTPSERIFAGGYIAEQAGEAILLGYSGGMGVAGVVETVAPASFADSFMSEQAIAQQQAVQEATKTGQTLDYGLFQGRPGENWVLSSLRGTTPYSVAFGGLASAQYASYEGEFGQPIQPRRSHSSLCRHGSGDIRGFPAFQCCT